MLNPYCISNSHQVERSSFQHVRTIAVTPKKEKSSSKFIDVLEHTTCGKRQIVLDQLGS